MIFTTIIVSRTFKKITIKLNKIFAINFKIFYIMIFIRITPLKLQNFPSNKKEMEQRNFMTQMRINVLKL